MHFHAAAFVGWMVFFTVQVAAIRTGHPALHRRLGLLGAGLAAVMAVLGPATAIVVDSAKYVAKHRPPTFVAIQFADIVVFAPLIVAGLLFRAAPATHRRLMLLATMGITDAGFARWWGEAVEAALGKAYMAEFLSLYAGPDLLILGFGAYDLMTRGRLHPAYMIGAPFILAVQLTATGAVAQPGMGPDLDAPDRAPSGPSAIWRDGARGPPAPGRRPACAGRPAHCRAGTGP